MNAGLFAFLFVATWAGAFLYAYMVWQGWL